MQIRELHSGCAIDYRMSSRNYIERLLLAVELKDLGKILLNICAVAKMANCIKRLWHPGRIELRRHLLKYNKREIGFLLFEIV